MEADPAFLRGLTQSRFSRRQFVRAGATAAAVAGFGSALSACGIAGTRDTGAPAGFDWASWWAKQQKHGVLDWANWPLYIDTSHGSHPSIDLFTKQTGIQVNYKPVIQDNASFFAQISPVLQAKQAIGYDLIVITDGWELTQLIAEPLADPARPLADPQLRTGTRGRSRGTPSSTRATATRPPGSPGSRASATTRA